METPTNVVRLRHPDVLAALLGRDAPNLSPAVIARLTATWADEYARWQGRDLSARRYAYVWADGVYLQALMAEQADCMLVLIGGTRPVKAAPGGIARSAEA